LDARVFAVAVVARLFVGTFVVGSTADGRATGEWVAFKTFEASAIGLMSGRVAFRVGAARICHGARVEALSVSADLRVSALKVTLTTNRDTFNQRVSGESFGTSADRFVARDEALGSSSAVARALAKPVQASFVGRAVIVPDAAGWALDGDGSAAAVVNRDVAFPASTDHGSEGRSVDDAANRRGITRS
jgi:hypothetical protein